MDLSYTHKSQARFFDATVFQNTSHIFPCEHHNSPMRANATLMDGDPVVVEVQEMFCFRCCGFRHNCV